MSNVTVILDAIQKGDPKATEDLLPLVYAELRKLAASKLAQQPPDQTLQPTALVHEAYLRLLGDGSHSWQNRRHFFAAALRRCATCSWTARGARRPCVTAAAGVAS